VLCDCNDFDPALQLSLRWQWSELALRAMREAIRHVPHTIDEATPKIEVRGEGKLFYTENDKANNQTHFTYGAALKVPTEKDAPPKPATVCTMKRGWSGRYCEPESECKLVGGYWSGHNCEAIPASTSDSAKSEWNTVWDGKLSKALGGEQLVGDVSSLKALSLEFHCGPKSAFGSTGGPNQPPASFKECLKNGVAANSRLKSEEPWRIYHADEVVVVATFATIDEVYCKSTNLDTEAQLCGSAKKDENLDHHLSSEEKTSTSGSEYRGLRTGAGFPNGAVKEVVLRPEDILRVNKLLVA
jgi:hypothetical protein